MNKWFVCKLCGLRHRTGLYGGSSSEDRLLYLVTAEHLTVVPVLPRSCPSYSWVLSLNLGDFCGNDLLFPASICPLYPHWAGLQVHPVTTILPIAVVNAIVALSRKPFCCILSLLITCGSTVSSGLCNQCTHETVLWVARPCVKFFSLVNIMHAGNNPHPPQFCIERCDTYVYLYHLWYWICHWDFSCAHFCVVYQFLWFHIFITFGLVSTKVVRDRVVWYSWVYYSTYSKYSILETWHFARLSSDEALNAKCG